VALAKSVTSVAIAKGAAASGSTLTLIKGALKIMAWSKAKTTVIAAVAVILAAGTTTMVVHHYRASGSIFSWTKELSDSDNANYERRTGTSPAQAARTFFEACGQENWEVVAKYWPPGMFKQNQTLMNTVTDLFGGVEIVSLGKPFKGGINVAKMIALQPNAHSQFGSTTGSLEYPGVFVPCEIRFRGGNVINWHLKIRCDNAKNSWYYDGGM
jgi:hypothetical protein